MGILGGDAWRRRVPKTNSLALASPRDVNECLDGTHKCGQNSVCINTVGSYSCMCLKGYKKNAENKCEDINECFDGTHKCGQNSVCLNRDGSYYCMCVYGYMKNKENK